MDSNSSAEERPSGIRRRWQNLHVGIWLPLSGVVIWILLILAIQIISPNPTIDSMPDNCPENSMNCVRVSNDGTSFRAGELEPPMMNATTQEVDQVIKTWLIDHRGGEILESQSENGEYFMHGKDKTNFLYFTDDVLTFSSCEENENRTIVTIQSQSRLGVGDLGVNHERISSLISYLNSHQWSGNSCNNNSI